MQTIAEAYRLGCKVFFFTGGEPFIYPRLTEACDAILNNHDTRVVILTNGKDVRKFEGWLKKKTDWPPSLPDKHGRVRKKP